MIDQAPDTWHDAPGQHYGDAYADRRSCIYATRDDCIFVTRDTGPYSIYEPTEDADAKALRSFWRGIAIGLSVMPVIGALVVAIVWGLS